MKKLLLSALLAATISGGAAAAAAAPKAGDTPRFVGPALDGRTLDLAAFRGHVTVVDLWATWCAPCRVDMPMLDGFYQDRRAQGLVVVGLSADRSHDIADARRVLSAFHFSGAALAQAKVNDFGMPRILPATYVLDAQGRVTAVFAAGGSPVTRQALEAAVDAAGRD